MNPYFYNRRDFLKSLGIASAYCASGLGSFTLNSCVPKPKINKRDMVFDLLTSDTKQQYIPAGFFIHFGENYRWGDAAVNRHLEYFNAIDMDFIKIQYEQVFPPLESIKNPENWASMPFYKQDFYEKSKSRCAYFRLLSRVIANGTSISSSFSPPW